MSKRLDSAYLKRLSRWYKTDVIKWASMPLVVLNPSSKLCMEAHDYARKVTEGDVHSDTLRTLMELEYDFPIPEFVLLNQMLKIEGNKNDPSLPNYNYYTVNIKEVDGVTQVSLIYPTETEGYVAIDLKYKKGMEPMLSYAVYNIDSGSNPRSITDSDDPHHLDVRNFMTALLLSILSFFYLLSKSDKHAVEVRGISHRKHNAKKPWQRTDLSTIQFLNALPRESKPHQGGTHQSPRYHQRRPTTRRLMHNRFKNHPKFGKTIHVKGSWVGERSSVVNGVTYKVL